MDDMHVVRTSVGEIVQKRLRVLKGPLVGCETRIRHVDRHKKLAMVRVGSSAAGEDFLLALPLEVPVKRDVETKAESAAETKTKAPRTEARAKDLPSIPLDPRDTSRHIRWYLATCLEGHEDAACAELRAAIPTPLITDAFVPRMEQQFKLHGEWKTETRVLLPGMFIVATGQIRRLTSKLFGTPLDVDLVRGADKWPAPIASDAQTFLGQVMDAQHVVCNSWSEIVDDELQVSVGPLKGLEHRVASFNRRRCYAMVRLRVGDDEYLLRMPLSIIARRETITGLRET